MLSDSDIDKIFDCIKIVMIVFVFYYILKLFSKSCNIIEGAENPATSETEEATTASTPAPLTPPATPATPATPAGEASEQKHQVEERILKKMKIFVMVWKKLNVKPFQVSVNGQGINVNQN